MLATATTRLPATGGWAFEFKWDGVRALVDVGPNGAHIHSRLGNEVTAAYPEIEAQAAVVGDALLDGEIVAIRDGRPSFELLQSRMHVRSAAEARRLATATPVTFVVFDLLRRYGVDLTARPFDERRKTLERWGAEHRDWTISPVFDDGPATEAAAREHGLEGVVGKRLGSRYRPGTRSPDWVKLRFVRTGDFAVVGWEAAVDHPGDPSSLVLAQYAGGGSWTLAGKVGSGLTGRTVRALRPYLVERAVPVFTEVPAPAPGRLITWTEPRVVVEVRFTDWTDEGRLRHPVFLRVREDKPVTEAVGEGSDERIQ